MLTRGMVERAARVFAELDNMPAYEEDQIRGLVVVFLRFVQKVETGGCEADALPLAKALIEHRYQWLAAHPQYAPVPTSIWSLPMVEGAIRFFVEKSAEPEAIDEVARHVRTFERVVKDGCVERGDAEDLAQAFLVHAHEWMEDNPKALDAYRATP